jgi:hypothetical protein
MAKRPTRSEARDLATMSDQPLPPRDASSSTEIDINREQANVPPDNDADTLARPNEDEIRSRAYQRYLERGGGDGQDFDDWLEAERELRHQ